jgi:uncharacterized protein
MIAYTARNRRGERPPCASSNPSTSTPAFAIESCALDDVWALLVDVVAAGANENEGVDFDVIAMRELRAEAAATTAQPGPRPGHFVVSAAVIVGCAVASD